MTELSVFRRSVPYNKLAGLLMISLMVLPVLPLSSSDPPVHRLTYPESWVVGDTLRFLVVGDTQNPKNLDKNIPERRAIFREFSRFLKETEGFILHVGDFVENGHKSKHWKIYFDQLFWDELPEEHRKRFFPLIGNHEYKTNIFDYGGGNLAPYYKRFPHIKKNPYYFFRVGNTVFVMMNSGQNGIRKLFGERWEHVFDEQKKWLQKDFFPFVSDKDSVQRIFVGFHKPACGTPNVTKNRESAKIMKLFEEFNTAQDRRFQITGLSGHVHTFSHMLIEYDGDSADSTNHFTIGTGGGTQRGKDYFKKVRDPNGLDLYRQFRINRAISQGLDSAGVFKAVRVDNEIFGYLDVTISDRITVVFMRYDPGTDGFFEEYTVTY